MRRCLTPEALLDAAEGNAAAIDLAHLRDCRRCRDAVDDLRTTLAELPPLDVPDPPPFFWASLNRRVREAIADEPRLVRAAWWRWDTVIPLAGMAAVLVALGVAMPGPAPAPRAMVTVAPAAPDPPAASAPASRGDDALALVVDLAGTVDDAGETLALGPLPELGEVAAAALTTDELLALEQLLREAVEKPTS